MMLYGRNSPYAFLRSIRPRHLCVVLLGIFVILEALVLATCTTSAVASYYLTALTFTATQQNLPIAKLSYHMGYFSSCVKSNASGSWSCGTNGYQLVLADPNFDANNKASVNLYSLVVNTGDLLRQHCMTPYVLLVAAILSFLILVLIASLSPFQHRNAYKILFLLSYASLSLTVIAAIWQETNIKTANLLLGEILNDYYDVTASYGSYTRAAIWTGTGIQILISICCLIIAVARSQENRFLTWWDYPRSLGGPVV